MAMAMAMAMTSGLVAHSVAPPATTTATSARGRLRGLLGLGFGSKSAAGWSRWSTSRQCQAAVVQGDAADGGGPWRWREMVGKDAPLLGTLHEKSMLSVLRNLEDYSLGREGEKFEGMVAGVIGAAAALLLLASASLAPAAAVAGELGDGFKSYYGTAASASSYGGYGGNSNKQTTAEYTFDVPENWKEKTITKIEKGTNGTDAEFDNPKHKEEKVYVTFLANFRQLAPIDRVLNNLALSDPVLQDIIAYSDGIKTADRKDGNGQLYYDYEIKSPVANVLVSVTCAKNKLYAHFVKAGPADWARDEPMLRRLHKSFQTVGAAPLEY